MTDPDLGDRPDGIDPVGVPTARGGHQAFLMVLAITVALLGLIFTLGWVVFHHLVAS